ncbi:MAG: glycosyltransferase family 4 protein [Candidatus Dormibacteria bacterium]
MRSAKSLQLAWLGHASGRRADGLSTYSEQVVQGLLERGAAVRFHHAAGDGGVVPGRPLEVVSWPSIKVKTVTVPPPGFKAQMAAWLNSRRPAVMHCSLSMTLADGWVAEQALRAGSATVVTFHLPFGLVGTPRATVMQELHRFWAHRLGSYQRVIVFTQDHLERLTGVGFARERLRVVPNAVDVDLFSPGLGTLRQARLPGAGLVVGYLGRLDPEKGIRQLLVGFRRAELGPDARLLVAGDGVLRPMVQRAAAGDPRVLHLGRLQGIRARVDFWRSIDLFCLPSSAEGLSLSLLEAMATGRAVAVTAAGGLEAAGLGGLELDPRRLADSVAARLSEAAQRPELVREKGALARSEAVRHHGVETMVDRLLDIYSELGAVAPEHGGREAP